jgi:hypothetical protein
MKIVIKILVALLVLTVLFLFVFCHIFINLNGKFILETKLKEEFAREAWVGSVRTRFPFDVVVKNIDVKDLFTIKDVYARGGLFDIFRGSLILSELKIKGAEFALVKTATIPEPPENKTAEEDAESAGSLQDAGQQEQNKTIPEIRAIPSDNIETGAFKFPIVRIKHLLAKDCVLNFIDYSLKDKELRFKIDNVAIKIDNFNFPVKESIITSFELKGKIPWENIEEKGMIDISGWIDLFKRNMQANVKIEDIDGVYLAPYYAGWVDLEKARIEKAKLNFSSSITGLDNDVNAACHLELTEIVFETRQDEEEQNRAEKIAQVVLDIFKDLNQGKIVLDFNYKTKMDSPELGINAIKLAFSDKINAARKGDGFRPEDVVKLPGKLIGGTISSAAEITKSVINGTVGVGRELKKAVEGSFKREDNTTDAALEENPTSVEFMQKE